LPGSHIKEINFVVLAAVRVTGPKHPVSGDFLGDIAEGLTRGPCNLTK